MLDRLTHHGYIIETAMTAIGSRTRPATQRRRAKLVQDKTPGHIIRLRKAGQDSMQSPGQYSLQINKQGNARSEPGESAFETNRDPGRITSIISSAQGGIPVFSQNQAVSCCKNLRYFIFGNGSGIHHRELSGNPSIQSNPLLQSGTGDAQVVPGASRLTCARGRHTTPGYPITCEL